MAAATPGWAPQGTRKPEGRGLPDRLHQWDLRSGSFVTSRDAPGDFDACWDEQGVDPDALDPVLLTFDPGRATQKGQVPGRAVSRDGPGRDGGAVVPRLLPDGQGHRRAEGHHRHRPGRSHVIKNERQYRITKAQAARFAHTLEGLKQRPDDAEGVHPRIARAQEEAVKSQLADLAGELREYEELKAGGFQLEDWTWSKNGRVPGQSTDCSGPEPARTRGDSGSRSSRYNGTRPPTTRRRASPASRKS